MAATPTIIWVDTLMPVRITGQAIGVGGDRLQVWAHPEPVVTEYHDGGWTYEALQEHGQDLLGGNLQPVGETFPPLPEELQATHA